MKKKNANTKIVMREKDTKAKMERKERSNSGAKTTPILEEAQPKLKNGHATATANHATKTNLNLNTNLTTKSGIIRYLQVAYLIGTNNEDNSGNRDNKEKVANEEPLEQDESH